MVTVIPPDLVDFLESGISTLLSTRDASLRPFATRATGTLVHPGRSRVTVLVSAHRAARLCADLADNGRIAAGFSRPTDNFSIQLKGRAAEVRPATDAERPIAERYLAAYVDMLYLVGMPRSLTKRVRLWPATAIVFDVEGVYVQTPGPGAGRPLVAR